MNDAFVAFWCGMLCGMVVGVMIFSVIIAIKTGELKMRSKIIAEAFEPDAHARQIFGGRCPYTGYRCETFACATCNVEAAEREWLKRED